MSIYQELINVFPFCENQHIYIVELEGQALSTGVKVSVKNSPFSKFSKKAQFSKFKKSSQRFVTIMLVKKVQTFQHFQNLKVKIWPKKHTQNTSKFSKKNQNVNKFSKTFKIDEKFKKNSKFSNTFFPKKLKF